MRCKTLLPMRVCILARSRSTIYSGVRTYRWQCEQEWDEQDNLSMVRLSENNSLCNSSTEDSRCAMEPAWLSDRVTVGPAELRSVLRIVVINWVDWGWGEVTEGEQLTEVTAGGGMLQIVVVDWVDWGWSEVTEGEEGTEITAEGGGCKLSMCESEESSFLF